MQAVSLCMKQEGDIDLITFFILFTLVSQTSGLVIDVSPKRDGF